MIQIFRKSALFAIIVFSCLLFVSPGRAADRTGTEAGRLPENGTIKTQRTCPQHRERNPPQCKEN
jgi:hypothetical protein